mgnify:CR=1 FL=1
MGGAGLSGTACYEEKHVKCKLKQTHQHEKVDGHQGYACVNAAFLGFKSVLLSFIYLFCHINVFFLLLPSLMKSPNLGHF